ncbi:hypothetical protein [Marinobacterium jannaschii]
MFLANNDFAASLGPLLIKTLSAPVMKVLITKLPGSRCRQKSPVIQALAEG